LDSILAQTYASWQCTIINNCSTDGSLAICREYAQQDARIQVEDNATFLPQLANMNRALKAGVKGSRYCKVALADDWLFPTCLADMVAAAERDERVGIVSAYRLDERFVSGDGLPFQTAAFSGADICRKTLRGEIFVFGSPNTLMLRSSIVRAREPFFNEHALHADSEACYEILKSYDLGFVHQVLTFTRRENESLTKFRATVDPEHCLDRLTTVTKYGKDFFDEREYRACLKDAETRYLDFIARAKVVGRKQEFWAFHEEWMTALGYEIPRLKFAKQLGVAAVKTLANKVRGR
jgi:glycosyltransferase involved in cell wall biosynthesis